MSIWAGQTLYTAHKLVLALSSSYFKLVLTGVAREGRLPVIFLKDVSSKDFERLLSYMYHGEVSVPQSDLLSLIGAARSLGIRGLAEELQENDHKQPGLTLTVSLCHSVTVSQCHCVTVSLCHSF